jgi:bis(5'-nucleosidyl)-tetraphosphatase
MADLSLVRDEAFGIIPVRQTDSGYRFLLIQHHAGHWGFPKGHADPGESAMQTAQREFSEETGIAECEVIDHGISFTETYTFARNHKRFEKVVVYFPAWVQAQEVSCQQEEIKAFVWADYREASSRLSFEGGKKILADVQRYLAERSD